MNSIEAAQTCYQQGYNCAQSVLAGFCSEFGLEQDIALRLAAALGGGMGRTAQTCGAVSGALMVIGLKFGQTDPQDKPAKERAYQLAQRFVEEFRLRHYDINCPGLLGVDISQPDGLAYARDNDIFNLFCPQFVRSAAEILETVLEE
jgi:C_GCAxxG_C_C family probable redox protein